LFRIRYFGREILNIPMELKEKASSPGEKMVSQDEPGEIKSGVLMRGNFCTG